jgi:leucyl aminopeptidase
MEGASSWVVKRLSEIHAEGGDKTVAVIVTKKEIKDGSANVSFLGHLTKSKEFRQDLNLTNAYWYYKQETLKRVLVVQVTDVNRQELRKTGVKAAQELQAKKADNAEVIVSDAIDAELLGIFANSFYLTNYEFTSKTDPATRDASLKEPSSDEDYDPRSRKFTKKITNVAISTKDSANVLTDAKYAFWIAAARGSEYARNVANVRATIATPEFMEQQVRKLVEGKAQVKEVRVVKGQQLVDLGMNLLHAVGKGATTEPRCVAVYYKGNPEKDDVDVAFVGKGITFDTGGLHLKPYGGMEQMYLDKGGACSVIGALHGTLELGIKMNVVFAMGLAENAIDAKSYKPMDILTSMKGYTVEIDNTDAEGRLILADTFTYV